jgi:hypothetical protein
MTPLDESSWSRFFEEFNCRGCGGQEAYRSRPRGFFEKRVLPLLLMQTVRCERCYHRFYAWRSIPVLEHTPAPQKKSQSQRPDDSRPDRRVA